jgi:hypothetical protein
MSGNREKRADAQQGKHCGEASPSDPSPHFPSLLPAMLIPFF